MNIKPLHPVFGAEITGVDLCDITSEEDFAPLRAAFEEHSLLLFCNQKLTDEAHITLARLLGPLEDRDAGPDGPKEKVSLVSNNAGADGLFSEEDWRLHHLQANQLWHTDSTFLPVPALSNILTARVISSSGGETEFVSTRVAFERLSADVQERLRKTVFTHRYAHSRLKISAEAARQELITKWPDQHWKAVFKNPSNGREAIYLASHICAVDGDEGPEALAFVDELMAIATSDDMVYSHSWQPGEVLIWDERATMHRGRPWPYEEERSLASICSTMTDKDGLAAVKAA